MPTLLIVCTECAEAVNVFLDGYNIERETAYLYKKGWAFRNRWLALCPMCVRAYKNGWVKNSIYDVLFEPDEGGDSQ